jgi:hypothetical protein
MAIFVSYCPQFWSSGVIYKAHDTQYMFERHDNKTHHFCILGLFLWAITHSFGIRGWFTRPITLSTVFRGVTKNLSFFAFLGHFHELLPTVLCFRSDLQGPWYSVHVWEAWPKTHRFCVLGPFLWAIAHCFGVPWRFTRNMTVCTF